MNIFCDSFTAVRDDTTVDIVGYSVKDKIMGSYEKIKVTDRYRYHLKNGISITNGGLQIIKDTKVITIEFNEEDNSIRSVSCYDCNFLCEINYCEKTIQMRKDNKLLLSYVDGMTTINDTGVINIDSNKLNRIYGLYDYEFPIQHESLDKYVKMIKNRWYVEMFEYLNNKIYKN